MFWVLNMFLFRRSGWAVEKIHISFRELCECVVCFKRNNNLADFIRCWRQGDTPGSNCNRWNTPTDIFYKTQPNPLSVVFLQERCRLRTARRPTKGSTSVWPPTLKAYATPLLQTFTCEVWRKHRTHSQTQTQISQPLLKVLLVFLL